MFAGRSYCFSTSTVREDTSACILDANVYKVPMSTLKPMHDAYTK
jgi:hypothetical protein